MVHYLQMIVGVDEVGRGCWAGPLVAGAVLLSKPIDGLADSKLLTPARRRTLDATIRITADGLGLGWVSVPELDALGLTRAVRLAMERALAQIVGTYRRIIIDGNYNFLAKVPGSMAMVGADGSEPAVSAASIIAKVARDGYMSSLSAKFPGYGFERHVGYGTAFHRKAIAELGVTELHRRSFKPIRELAGGNF